LECLFQDFMVQKAKQQACLRTILLDE